MVARTVGICAREGTQINPKYTACQVVNDKWRVVNEMQDRSNAWLLSRWEFDQGSVRSLRKRPVCPRFSVPQADSEVDGGPG